MRTALLYFINLILFLFVSWGCAKKTVDPVINLDQGKVNPKAKVVEPNVIKDALLAQSSSIMAFDANNRFAQSIAVGDILVADISKTFPYGFLIEVTSVNVRDNTIYVSFKNSTLNDLFVEGSFDFAGSIVPDDSSGRVNGETYTQDISAVLFDLDKNEKTVGDQISLNGTTKIDAETSFDFDKVLGSEAHIQLRMKGKIENNYKFMIGQDNIEVESEIHRIIMLPWSRVVYGFPVVIARSIIFYSGGSFSLPLENSIGFEYKTDVDASLSYKNGSWGMNRVNSNPTGDLIIPGSVKKEGSLKVYVKSVFEANPYGIGLVTGSVGVEGGLDLSFNCDKDSDLTLSKYLSAIAKTTIEFNKIFGLKNSYNNSVDLIREIIWKKKMPLCGQGDFSGSIEIESMQKQYCESIDSWHKKCGPWYQDYDFFLKIVRVPKYVKEAGFSIRKQVGSSIYGGCGAGTSLYLDSLTNEPQGTGFSVLYRSDIGLHHYKGGTTFADTTPAFESGVQNCDSANRNPIGPYELVIYFDTPGKLWPVPGSPGSKSSIKYIIIKDVMINWVQTNENLEKISYTFED